MISSWFSPYRLFSFNPPAPLPLLDHSQFYIQATSERPKYLDISYFPRDRIRNFGILAHIDHGKSTLSDRILEATGALQEGDNKQVLDNLQVERERGITVKAQSATMIYHTLDNNPGSQSSQTNNTAPQPYLFNLCDTPGHVDFSNEVTKSLRVCQGIVLLVDAVKGVQAQTVSHYDVAKKMNLPIIPVINKIDMLNADPFQIAEQIENCFPPLVLEDIIFCSAKTGEGIPNLLQSIRDRFPPPPVSNHNSFRAFIFDSEFESHRGILAKVFVDSGEIQAKDEITAASTNQSYKVTQVGLLTPFQEPQPTLTAGQIGYLFCGMKTIQEAQVGDTLFLKNSPLPPHPGFEAPGHTLFCGLYPLNPNDFNKLNDAVSKLALNDPSVSIAKHHAQAVGNGFHCGFLGMLHLDVFRQRLSDEYDSDVIITNPTVPYTVQLKDGSSIIVDKPDDLPAENDIEKVMEPIMSTKIILPVEFVGAVMDLCTEHRGELFSQESLDSETVTMTYILPLNEIALNFHDRLKSITSGFASLTFEPDEPKPVKLARLDFKVHDTVLSPLSTLVPRSKAEKVARETCKKLAELISRHQFTIPVQALIGSKIIARETIRPFRKDVTEKLYGGDVTRRKKLLEKQKKGKKRMKAFGKVNISSDVFVDILKR